MRKFTVVLHILLLFIFKQFYYLKHTKRKIGLASNTIFANVKFENRNLENWKARLFPFSFRFFFRFFCKNNESYWNPDMFHRLTSIFPRTELFFFFLPCLFSFSILFLTPFPNLCFFPQLGNRKRYTLWLLELQPRLSGFFCLINQPLLTVYGANILSNGCIFSKKDCSQKYRCFCFIFLILFFISLALSN